MKKLLILLASATLCSAPVFSVVACGNVTAPGGDENLPDANFKLDKNQIDIDTKNPGNIKITNWEILNNRSKPTKFTYSEEGIVQATTGLEGQITISPLANAKKSVVKITAESEKGHKEVITVNVNEIQQEDQFKLDKTSLYLKTSKYEYLTIVNWDSLSEDKKPSEFIFNKEGYASAELDSANKRIKVTANNQAVDDLKLTIKSSSNTSVDVNIKITLAEFDLAQENLVLNVMAGNMTNGLIDSSIAIGDEGFKVTEESVLASFNEINGLNLLLNDLNIEIIEGTGNNGIGAQCIIAAKEGNQNVKGETTLILNQNIDPVKYFVNTNLGEIRLFKGSFNQLDKVLANSKDSISLAAIIFEQVGAKNKQLEYIKNNLVKDLGAPGKELMSKSTVSATTFKINGMPDLKGIFKANSVIEFTQKFVQEDRITIYESLPENKKVNISAQNLVDKSKSGQKNAKTEVYNQLSQEFKSKISLSHFIEFTNIIFNTKDDNGKYLDFKFDVLPGSDILYGHDGAAFQSYISPGFWAGIGTGAGNLAKYEENKKFEERHSKGMGYFDMTAATKGNFYQGHDIIVLNQKPSEAISDKTFKITEELQIDFAMINMLEGQIVTVESDKSDITAELIDKGENNYSIKLNSSKATKNANITIKVNGYKSQSFKVTSTN
ncbi:hypothetical protein [Spiroplasma floricola]|uniref:Lipoprotein n=1 Tax=Spiroplasma floricola 23-6 TaxID=1336749 RepID=A0A2K8SFM8_9MOLU|nr:hypothetical protein [Spiroplasma floricola]AUB32058.1 hypothetical protein SFLOR_v1c10100 [Spiroplasma floricola 23-6]